MDGKKKVRKVVVILSALVLLVLPIRTFASAQQNVELRDVHTHRYVSNIYYNCYSSGSTHHTTEMGTIDVCSICALQVVKIEKRFTDPHNFGNEYYNGVNTHVGSQHKIQYKKDCSTCRYSSVRWSDPYPCPGNGNCIVPYSIEPEEK